MTRWIGPAMLAVALAFGGSATIDSAAATPLRRAVGRAVEVDVVDGAIMGAEFYLSHPYARPTIM